MSFVLKPTLQSLVNTACKLYTEGHRMFISNNVLYYSEVPTGGYVMCATRAPPFEAYSRDIYCLDWKKASYVKLKNLYSLLSVGRYKGNPRKVWLIENLEPLIKFGTFDEYVLRLINNSSEREINECKIDYVLLESIDPLLCAMVRDIVRPDDISFSNELLEFLYSRSEVEVVERKEITDIPFTKNACAICFENEAIMVLNPCGHAKFCNQCIQQHMENSPVCPICRSRIESTIRIYND